MAGTTISSAAVNSNFSDIATALTGSLARDGSGGMTGQLKSVDGSAASPSISFSSDITSGFYKAAANQIGLSIAGVQALLFTSSGLSGLMPVGLVSDWAGPNAPTQWLLCYGQAVSRTTYSALYNIIGNIFGSGDGTTTFNVPDLRGRTTFGRDDMGGAAAGRLGGTFYGGNPVSLGSPGGGQANSLSSSNMANFQVTGTVSIFDPGHIHANQAYPSRGADGNNFSVLSPSGGQLTAIPNTVAAGTGISASFAGNNNGGSSAAFSNVPPGIIMNKIIFAGA